MKNKQYRLSEDNVLWLLSLDKTPNKAVTRLRIDTEVTVRESQVLNARIDQLEKKVKSIQGFIDSHSGY